MIEMPLTREQFEAKSKALQARGVEVAGDSGTLSRMGVTARYAYDGARLRVEVLEKPFFMTEAYCEEQLRGFLGA